MELPLGQSIFDKMKTSYDVFRKEEFPIKKLKEYYRGLLKDGQELWWIDDVKEQPVVSPVIQTFNQLEPSEQHKFRIESFVLFPEILGENIKKFERSAIYMIPNYNAYSRNFRDVFTAGGKVELKISGEKVVLSQIFSKLYNIAGEIEAFIESVPNDKLEFYWWKGERKIEGTKIDAWKEEISKIYTKEKASPISVYNEGVINHERRKTT